MGSVVTPANTGKRYHALTNISIPNTNMTTPSAICATGDVSSGSLSPFTIYNTGNITHRPIHMKIKPNHRNAVVLESMLNISSIVSINVGTANERTTTAMYPNTKETPPLITIAKLGILDVIRY